MRATTLSQSRAGRESAVVVPTRLNDGEGRSVVGNCLVCAPTAATGVMGVARTADIIRNVGAPHTLGGESDGSIVSMKPVSTGGEKGPQVSRDFVRIG